MSPETSMRGISTVAELREEADRMRSPDEGEYDLCTCYLSPEPAAAYASVAEQPDGQTADLADYGDRRRVASKLAQPLFSEEDKTVPDAFDLDVCAEVFRIFQREAGVVEAEDPRDKVRRLMAQRREVMRLVHLCWRIESPRPRRRS